MKVKIKEAKFIKSDPWYRICDGHEFDVYDELQSIHTGDKRYKVKYDRLTHYISPEDCEVVKSTH